MYSASPQYQLKETHLTLETTLINHFAQFGQVLEVNSLRRPDPMRFVPQSTLDGEDESPVLLKVSLMSRDSRAPMLLIETEMWRASGLVKPADIAKVVARRAMFPQIGKMNVRTVPLGHKTEILAKVEHIIPARGLARESIEVVIEAMARAHRRMISDISKAIRDQQEAVAKVEKARQIGLEAVMDEMKMLVGLRPVKTMIRQLAVQQQVVAQRAAFGLESPMVSPHLVFTGNPGTGKTTVARHIGQMYKSLGLLSSGHVVEADRSSLVAAYLGQTAMKTEELCKKALGGVLFIDEAYSLDVVGRDYGSEAIETILTFMENNRGNIAVIVAGYPVEMESFLSSNPGLRSRFDMTLHFPDYSDNELFEILFNLFADNSYGMSPEVIDALQDVVTRLPRGGAFGNARDVRKLFTAILFEHAARVSRFSSPTREQLVQIHVRDIERALPQPKLVSLAKDDFVSLGYL